MPNLAVQLTNINKNFGNVCANKNISLTVKSGTIHGIVGENGAGKSTLMSVLYGFYQADSGSISVLEKQTIIRSAYDAIKAGIGMVHQHFMLVDTFTVLENVVLGTESGISLKESLRASEKELKRLKKEYLLEVDINTTINRLPVGLQQRVEILKALYRGAEILILDEPTGVLTPQEADHLFRILDELRKQRKTVILITHKLREIMAITDYVSVMREGEMVAHRKTSETNREELAELMVGRKVLLSIEKVPANPGKTVLSVENLDFKDNLGVQKLKDISFSVNSGEIVGVAGVSGNGQSELLDIITGIKPLQKGTIRINDQEITYKSRVDAASMRRLGVAHVPEDRQRMGLVTSFTASENIILGYHRDHIYNGLIEMDSNAITKSCLERMGNFDVRPVNPQLRVSLFSGGNQQKIVVAREMERKTDLLIVGQPTRGVDIGAIEFIHRQIIAMRDANKAVLLVSVELDEILSLSDRILVMFDGKIMGEVLAKDSNERDIGLLMAGIHKEDI